MPRGSNEDIPSVLLVALPGDSRALIGICSNTPKITLSVPAIMVANFQAKVYCPFVAGDLGSVRTPQFGHGHAGLQDHKGAQCE